jgi:hypothetical protein
MVRGWQLARSSAALGAVGRSSAAASTEPIIYHLHAAKALSERAARGGRTWHPSNPTTGTHFLGKWTAVLYFSSQG